MVGREQLAAFGGRVVADHVVERDQPRSRAEPLELVGEDEVLLGHHAVEDDDVAFHLLDQRTDRA